MAACEVVELIHGEALAKRGEPTRHVYFPNGAIVALVERIDDRASVEVGQVGEEGMVGTALVLGVNRAPLHALVQGTGAALSMAAGPFCSELKRNPALRDRLQRYVQVLMRQLAQSAGCNRFHVVEARLARWLLMTRDRADSDSFHVTHAFLADMLGVRRVGITKAASDLQQHRLIRYHRGEVTIIDPAGLETAACSCYAIDKASYAQDMG
jgi:CRP-like cAMP-binding protein